MDADRLTDLLIVLLHFFAVGWQLTVASFVDLSALSWEQMEKESLGDNKVT